MFVFHLLKFYSMNELQPAVNVYFVKNTTVKLSDIFNDTVLEKVGKDYKQFLSKFADPFKFDSYENIMTFNNFINVFEHEEIKFKSLIVIPKQNLMFKQGVEFKNITIKISLTSIDYNLIGFGVDCYVFSDKTTNIIRNLSSQSLLNAEYTVYHIPQ